MRKFMETTFDNLYIYNYFFSFIATSSENLNMFMSLILEFIVTTCDKVYINIAVRLFFFNMIPLMGSVPYSYVVHLTHCSLQKNYWHVTI